MAPEQGQDLAVVVLEVFAAGADGEAGAAPVPAVGHAWAGGHGGCFGAVDRFDDFVGPLDDVEGVEADSCLWDLFAGDGQVDAAAVEADRFDRGGPVGS